jgi:RNA polymerase sigma-70 factor (ECF subfamily)
MPSAEAISAVEEQRLVSALQAGDERAFGRIVDAYHAGMLRVARTHVKSDAVAEEVVQDTWSAVVKGIARFEGRSSLKTWLYRIVTNRASTTAVREGRSVPLSALATEDETTGPAVPVDRFVTTADGHWARPPRPWEDAGRRLESLELRDELRDALGDLPRRQQLVVALRDVEGLASEEVRELLDLSEANQRVLLHRGRARLRQALEDAHEGAPQAL